jgi:putative colanic acid biosynthesis glycosyltransferase
MKVLHLNIRASQGGAGRMALDLHQRLLFGGADSRLIYGYASGIADDPSIANDPTVRRLATKWTVLGNYASHLVTGMDLFTANKKMLVEEISRCDVVHLHVPHHYFLNWEFFCKTIIFANKPLLITAHDWWFITGRCGFVEQCTGWQRQCGECGKMRFRDLPSLIDWSRFHRVRKLQAIGALGAATTIVCPSTHLSQDYHRVLKDTSITVIPNSIDVEFERVLNTESGSESVRSGLVFSAADLTAPGKIDSDLVRGLLEFDNIKIQLVGRNNPFDENRVTYCGEVRDREKMVKILCGARALVFCSRMDNAPLTIIEALVTGCFVLAYDSPAAREILASVGGECIPDRETMMNVIRENCFEKLYGNIGATELARRARDLYSGDAIRTKYLEVYKELCERAALDEKQLYGQPK